MKRIFTILAAAALIIAACVCTSCNKADSLVNTSWTNVSSPTAKMTITNTFSFTSDKDVKLTAIIVVGSEDPDTEVVTGTYTYTKPTITMNFPGQEVETMTGTISGNVMTVTTAQGPTEFTKQ